MGINSTTTRAVRVESLAQMVGIGNLEHTVQDICDIPFPSVLETYKSWHAITLDGMRSRRIHITQDKTVIEKT
jgi:hypothetical protein